MEEKQREFITKMYEEYFPKIYNYVYYQVNNYAVSDDLVSCIFEKVVKNIELFDEKKSSFSTWIFSIARHTIIDYYRSMKQESDIDQFEGTVVLSLSFEDVYRIYTEKHYGEIEEVISVLNEKEKEVIYLRYFQGLGFQEISLQTGRNSSSLRTLHERALKKMLKFFEEKGIRYEDII